MSDGDIGALIGFCLAPLIIIAIVISIIIAVLFALIGGILSVGVPIATAIVTPFKDNPVLIAGVVGGWLALYLAAKKIHLPKNTALVSMIGVAIGVLFTTQFDTQNFDVQKFLKDVEGIFANSGSSISDKPVLEATTSLNVRDTPTVNIPNVIGKINVETSYEVIGRNASDFWLEIELDDKTGWVCKQFTTLANTPTDILAITNDSSEDCSGQTVAVVPVPDKEPRKVIVFLHGVCSEVDDGVSTGSQTFNDLQKLLRKDYEFSNSDFLLYSYKGGSMENINGSWMWHHKSYDSFTPVNQDFQTTSVDELHNLLIEYRDKYPNTTFILIGHSLGGVIAMEEVLQNVMMFDYEEGLISTVITVDSPLHGLPSGMSKLWLGRNVNALECVVNGQAFQRLFGLYESEPSYTSVLEHAVTQAQQKDVTIVTVGNQSDCVLSPKVCSLGFSGDIETQYISNALIHKFNIARPCTAPLDYCIQGTHSAILSDRLAPNQLETIAGYIGRQN